MVDPSRVRSTFLFPSSRSNLDLTNLCSCLPFFPLLSSYSFPFLVVTDVANSAGAAVMKLLIQSKVIHPLSPSMQDSSSLELKELLFSSVRRDSPLSPSFRFSDVKLHGSRGIWRRRSWWILEQQHVDGSVFNASFLFKPLPHSPSLTAFPFDHFPFISNRVGQAVHVDAADQS